jgi:hypothetical protein
MTYDQRPFRGARDERSSQQSGNVDPKLRELLGFLRDTCREVAVRIDRYLGDERPAFRSAYGERDGRDGRDSRDGRNDRNDRNDRGYSNDRGYASSANRFAEPPRAPRTHGGDAPEVHDGLEKLREEARRVSDDAPDMEPAKLRLLIEAITAETRAQQSRADDPDDQDLAAKILRTLTAVVSEHRPGHVYGLARHHTADWSDVARRARDDLASGNFHRARPEDSSVRTVREVDDADVG